MTKRNLIIVFVALAIALCRGIKAEAQIFKSSGKTAAELSTKEIVNQAEGDFNKDGIKDLFIATDYGSAYYFGKAGGSYSLFLDTDMPVSSDAKLSVTDKGVLRIQTPHSTDSHNHSRAERLAVVSSIKLPRFHLGQRENTFAYLQTA